MSGHTPGPWKLNDFEAHPVVWKGEENVRNHALIARVSNWSGEGSEWRDQAAANALLIASAPDLLAAVESEYIFLADIHNEWPGRHTAEGQMKLCRLRDLICKATGREAQDVQDDYGSRNLVNVVEGDAS